MPKLITIQPDGTLTEKVWADDGTRPDLATLQAAVGGLIQPVDAFLPEGVEAYANEEGVLRGFKANPAGSKAVNWPVGETDTLRGLAVESLVGPIVILEGFPTHEEIDEEIDAAFESGDAEFCPACRGLSRKIKDPDRGILFRCTKCGHETEAE